MPIATGWKRFREGGFPVFPQIRTRRAVRRAHGELFGVAHDRQARRLHAGGIGFHRFPNISPILGGGGYFGWVAVPVNGPDVPDCPILPRIRGIFLWDARVVTAGLADGKQGRCLRHRYRLRETSRLYIQVQWVKVLYLFFYKFRNFFCATDENAKNLTGGDGLDQGSGSVVC